MLVDICAMIALGFAVLVGCLGFMRRRSIAENWKKRLIRKAKKQGSYIEAVAVKNEERANGTYFTVYEYQVGENKYRKKITCHTGSECRDRIIIYYNRKNPWQGVCEEITEMQGVGLCIFCRAFLTLIAVFFLLTVMLGVHNPFGDEMAMVSEEWNVIFSNPQILISGAAVIALYGLEMRWISQREAAREKRKEDAIAAGRTVLGKRVKSWYKSSGKSGNYRKRKYYAVYEYEVNGKKYKCGAHSEFTELPNMMWFYYTDSPDKVFCDYHNSDIVVQLLAPVLFILPIAVVYFCAKLLGVDLEILKNG